MTHGDVREQLQATLGDAYRIERELPPGGMSRLFLATEQSLNRKVVIKLLPPEYASEVSAARFQREVTLTAQLQHPHILPIFAAASKGGLLYYVMPYVEGESLRQRLTREGRLSVAGAVKILQETADALAHAHKAGIVHRDIKPENILLQGEHAVLADFGVARALHEATGGGRLTETGTGLGTPAYMAPEQLAGERNVDARADVYALAVVGYEMLAGAAPFAGATPQAVASAHFATAPRSLTQVRTDVPQWVSAAIGKALAKEPDQRFATAADFRDALSPTATRGAFGVLPQRLVGAFATILVVGLVAAGTMVWRGRVSRVEGPPMLAVLPFENEGDTANAYFAEGIADEIRGRLSALSALRVVATTSSNQYRHTTKSPEQISRELGVHYLLTGSVAWAQADNGARRVRISPELVEIGASGPPESRWHQSFDTTLVDVFAVQASVATQVADRLGIVLSPPSQTRLAARPTKSIAAYDAYLRSMALEPGDPATVRRSVAAAEEAVALDPGFAAAWARVGNRHALLYGGSVGTRDDSLASAHAAERAIALAPTAPEGYVARGFLANVSNDPSAAIAACGLAVQSAPRSADALGCLGFAEHRIGQTDSALVHLRRAEASDPRSTLVVAVLTGILADLHKYPEAAAEVDRGLAIAPGDLGLINQAVEVQLLEGNLAGAQAAIRNAPPTLDHRALVQYIANAADLYWVLDSADRVLLMTLPASWVDDNRGHWAQARAEVEWLRGNVALARAWADTSSRAFEAQLRSTPKDVPVLRNRALMLAYLGQGGSAVREIERAEEIERVGGQASPGEGFSFARAYVALGDTSHAIDALEQELKTPSGVSAAWLRIDPEFASLRGNPRFERLIADTGMGRHHDGP